MIEIEIDHNNNKINISNRVARNGACLAAISYPINKGSTDEFKSFLIELFNVCNFDVNTNIVITEVDEDNRRTVEEW